MPCLIANCRLLALSFTATLMFFASSLAVASTPEAFPDANASDPAKLGWMIGPPPAADRTIHFDGGCYFRFPAMRWSVSNFPGRIIARVTGRNVAQL